MSNATLFTPLPSPGKVDSLAQRGVDVSMIAQLAFARAGDDSVAAGRHLALLPIESLELDLSDPAQCQFGDYELLELIGEGGMGVVYRARQRSLDREVAIKLLAAGVWASTEFVERFRREAQNAARMQHPNIVPVYEVGDHDGLHFFSMRLIAGPSLAAELKREKRLSPQRAAHLLRTIAEAVDYAHRLGVLHLDLKPANVLIDENGIPHVADFGLARRIDSALAADSDEVSGTPSYMAPEQASPRASRITRATDIWGLGAILYELVTGEPPFLAHTAQETLKLVVQGTLRSPRRHVPDLPRDLEAVILKCMAYRVDERYASARDLADDLSRYLEGRAVRARPLNAAQRAFRWARREPKLAAMTLCAFAALLIGLAATTKQWQRADDNAQQAQANALVARERLWDSRDAASLRLLDDGEGWNAAPLLAANVEEMEAAGAVGRAEAARRRLGIVENANPRLTDVLSASTALVSAISPDGSRVAICADPLQVQMIEIASGKQLWARKYPPETADYVAVTFVAFSPDGKSLLLESRDVPMAPFPRDFDVAIDAATGELRVPPAAFADVSQASFSANGRVAILTDSSARSQLWSTDPWRPLGPLRQLTENPGLPFVFAQIAPDDRRFVYTHHGRIAVADGTTMRERAISLSRDFGAISAWAISPDWGWIVVGDREGHLAAIDTRDMSVHGLEPKPFQAVHAFRFSDDGTLLAGAAGTSGIYVWRWPLGELVSAPFGGPLEIDNVEIDAGRNRVLALASDGSASLWQFMPAASKLDRNTALRFGDRFGHAVPAPLDYQSWHNGAVTWLPALDLLAVSDGATRLARLPPAVLKRTHGAPIRTTSLHFDGQRLAAVDGNRVQVVDALRETPLAAPIELPQPPSFAEVAAGDALVVVEGRRLHSFAINDSAERFAPIELANSPLHVDVSPNGQRAATGWLDHGEYGTGEVIELWDLVKGARIGGPLRIPGPFDGLAFSASGRRLLAYSSQNVTLRDGANLDAVSDALADLRAPGFRQKLDLGIFVHVAFDGDELLLIEIHGDGRELKGPAELHRYTSDRRTSSQRVAKDWKAILPVPVSHDLLTVANDDALALRAAGGKVRPLRDSSGAQGGTSLAASADGRWLARGLRDGVDLFDANDGRRIARLQAPLPLPDRVWQLAFSPDGNRLLGRSVRNRWLVWDIAPEARPHAAVRRELELAGVDLENTPAPASENERAALRERDPGAPAPAARPAQQGVRSVAGGGIAARSADASQATVDLTSVYNLGLNEVSRTSVHSPADFAWLPQGVQRLLGIDYDIRGAIQLRDQQGFYEQPMLTAPRSVHAPVARQRAATVDALMMSALACTADPNQPFALVGLDFVDGTTADLPVRCDFDLFHWRQISGLGDHAQVAALGLDARLISLLWRPVHVYAVHLANPHPEKIIQGVRLIAGPGSGGGPIFLAVTLESVPEAAVDAH